MKNCFIIFFYTILSPNAFSQLSNNNSIDQQLTNLYKKVVATSQEERSSAALLFETELLKNLKSSVTFENRLDSLEKYITIRTSNDKKLKFYSWDELAGGSWHSIICYAQFKTGDGHIIVQKVNSGESMENGDFTDSEAYEINELKIDNNTYYLTFSWGTHGSGRQHSRIEIYSIIADKLAPVFSLLPENKSITLEYPRVEKLNLFFDPIKKEINYNEFSLDGETGTYRKTGKLIILKLISEKFVYQR